MYAVSALWRRGLERYGTARRYGTYLEYPPLCDERLVSEMEMDDLGILPAVHEARLGGERRCADCPA